jgi:hypothetical protein
MLRFLKISYLTIMKQNKYFAFLLDYTRHSFVISFRFKKMKFYLFFLLGIFNIKFLQATCSIRGQFDNFLEKYNLSYPDPVEYSHRFQVFSDNVDLIKQINSNPNVTYTAGINQFAALVNIFLFKVKFFVTSIFNNSKTTKEFLTSYTGAIVDNVYLNVVKKDNSERKKRQLSELVFISNPLSWPRLPDSIDWRLNGYVNPVQDQGTCNSCWLV